MKCQTCPKMIACSRERNFNFTCCLLAGFVEKEASVTSLGIQSTVGGCVPGGLSLSQPTVGPVAQGSSKKVTSLTCFLQRHTQFEKMLQVSIQYHWRTKRVRGDQNILCASYLKVNHLARRCRMAKACIISGFGKRHHSLKTPQIGIRSGIECVGSWW